MAIFNCQGALGAKRTAIKMVGVAVGGDNSDRPVALIGQIKKQATKGRPTPPKPISGFETAYTPFDNGHIFGLENGGPDISENIVPQYRFWQQSGTWRQTVENAINSDGSTNDGFFVVELTYPAAHTDYVLQSGYYNSDPPQLFNWSDLRIPDSFAIWVVKKDTKANSLWSDINTYLAPGALDEAAFDALMVRVRATAKYLPDLDHSAMPEEDRYQIQNKQICSVAFDSYGSFLEEREMEVEEFRNDLTTALADPNPAKRPKITKSEVAEVADLLRSPVRTEDVYFTTFPDRIVKELEALSGPTAMDVQWTPSELSGVGAHRVVTATVTNGMAVGQVKARNKRNVKYRDEHAAREKRREDYKKKGVEARAAKAAHARGVVTDLDPKTGKPV